MRVKYREHEADSTCFWVHPYDPKRPDVGVTPVEFGSAVTDIQNIAAMVGAAVMGIVGVIGIGRAAYKFSNGEHDSVTALVMGIVALVLGAISATFI